MLFRLSPAHNRWITRWLTKSSRYSEAWEQQRVNKGSPRCRHKKYSKKKKKTNKYYTIFIYIFLIVFLYSSCMSAQCYRLWLDNTQHKRGILELSRYVFIYFQNQKSTHVDSRANLLRWSHQHIVSVSTIYRRVCQKQKTCKISKLTHLHVRERRVPSTLCPSSIVETSFIKLSINKCIHTYTYVLYM